MCPLQQPEKAGVDFDCISPAILGLSLFLVMDGCEGEFGAPPIHCLTPTLVYVGWVTENHVLTEKMPEQVN